MRRGIGSALSTSVRIPGSRLTALAPGRAPAYQRYSLFCSSRSRPSCESSTPQLAAKACAARVGCPSASKAARTGGPRRRTVCAGCCAARRETRTARRRGVANEATGPWRRWAAASWALRPARSACSSSGSALGGSSSVPISNRKSRRSLRAVSLMRAPLRWPLPGRQAAEIPAPRGWRSRPAPRRAPACARAGGSAGAR